LSAGILPLPLDKIMKKIISFSKRKAEENFLSSKIGVNLLVGRYVFRTHHRKFATLQRKKKKMKQ
jgi:hypothetical protein